MNRRDAERQVVRHLTQQLYFRFLERSPLPRINSQRSKRRARHAQRQRNHRRIAALYRRRCPRRESQIVFRLRNHLRYVLPNRPSHRTSPRRILRPRHYNVVEISLHVPGYGHRANCLALVRHGVTDPRHAVLAQPHNHVADLVEQFLLAPCLSQRLIARTQRAQRPVQPS